MLNNVFIELEAKRKKAQCDLVEKLHSLVQRFDQIERENQTLTLKLANREKENQKLKDELAKTVDLEMRAKKAESEISHLRKQTESKRKIFTEKEETNLADLNSLKKGKINKKCYCFFSK
jgi:hypothetical protein